MLGPMNLSLSSASAKKMSCRTFHCPIPKYRGGAIPAESDPRDAEIADLRNKIRSLEKYNRTLITKLTTTMDMDFNGHVNEIVVVWKVTETIRKFRATTCSSPSRGKFYISKG